MFQRIIPDSSVASQSPQNVKKVIFCSGKVYYDLKKAREDRKLENDITITRVEQISPFPYDLIKSECAKYPNAQLSWAQEEHKNQGPWFYVQPRFETALTGSRDVVYVGRPTAASPATGSKAQHLKELSHLLDDAMAL
ncbi:hypothetical protein Zmor_016087 [Zophobas morio]|uniref:2-oxoglutarate dehydrogenase E1 component/KDG C-terminal domain-containing protein n=1 Tax=Zophobas morio TaxID=2755281 RepID=A0AA38MI48_9CUCU|nr:hypothetical protein Zmor_016087 [Zophobas morio]